MNLSYDNSSWWIQLRHIPPTYLHSYVHDLLCCFNGQIINIHTAKMRSNGRLRKDAEERLPDLAQLTKNFTGEYFDTEVFPPRHYSIVTR